MDRIIPNGISILIVDDNYDDVIILSRYLEDYNVSVEVSSVQTGEEAIEKLKNHKYDLCIFDLNLPGIGGLDLIKHVTAHGDNLPTIMITGQGDEKKAVQAMKLGVCDYLVKDEIDPTLLNKTVYYAIEGHRNKIEKERLQEELQAYTERLEEMVEERTREIIHLNSYNELILGSLEEYVRVVDPVKETIQYENSKIKYDFGSNKGNSCFKFWNRDDTCENCVSKKAIEEWSLMHKEEVVGNKIFTVSAIPLKNMDGSLSAIEVIRDVTEQRRTEEELTHKRRLAEMGEMAAHIAHDIRNPLNSLGLSYEILDRCPDIKGLDRESLEIMGKGIERLTSITNDLLDYGRSDKLNKESFDILGVIDNLLSELGDKISKSGIEVVKKVPMESTTLNADKVKIHQVLINVISNAIESMPEGGTLTLLMSEENGKLMVAVSDAGCGIPKEDIDNIFVPFFTTKKQGTGLGLAIVKHFIDLHSGDISVDSEVGSGTTITITLPL